jgi:predicted nucleic acid-binding protein
MSLRRRHAHLADRNIGNLVQHLQAASALAINASALVTYDRDFSRVHSLRIIS